MKRHENVCTKQITLFVGIILLIVLIGLQPSSLVEAENTQQDVEQDYAWTAYNDLFWLAGQPETNITKYTITDGENTGQLINHDNGGNLTAQVTITTSGAPFIDIHPDRYGSEAAEETDAYALFHGKASSVGLIAYGDSGWYVDITFSGLEPEKTYTFATTANRAGGNYTPPGSPSYLDRLTKFTLDNDNRGATNTSSFGGNGNETIFSTGENTTNGYVARWINIVPRLNGSFTIRAESATIDSDAAYGPSVFLLAEEGLDVKDTHTLTVNIIGDGTVDLDPPGGTYENGVRVTLTPSSNFIGWSGANVGDLEYHDGTSINMDSDKNLTANFQEGPKAEVSIYLPLILR